MIRSMCLSVAAVLLIGGCADTEVVSEVSETVEPVATFAAGESATLEIPGMSCQMACYPKIKKTLEGLEGVEVVELVPQEEEVAINDHRVIVKFDADVEQDSAMDALAAAGYDEVNVQ